MAHKHLTIYDIGREAGVSGATVSRVLSGHPNVSRATREKVQAVVEHHQFKPSSIARMLEHGQIHILGIIMPAPTHPYYAELYAAAYDEASKRGYTLLHQELGEHYAIGQNAVDFMISQRLDGVLFLGGATLLTRTQLAQELSTLQKHMPVVALGAPMQGLDCIYLCNDLQNAVRDAVQHLVALGHRRIAFIGGENEVLRSGARGKAYLESILKFNVINVDYERGNAEYFPESGELAVLNLLSRRERKNWPTALIAINDLVALGAMRQLRRMGLVIPEDMALIGCDNLFFSTFTDPPLTTIDLQASDHARSAIRVLLSECANRTTPFTRVREATLIIRESCGAALGKRNL